MIDKRRLLAERQAFLARTSDLPHRCNGARDKNQKESSLDRVVGQVILSNVMLALTPATINDWNLVSFGESTYSTAEPTGHPHQMGVVQLLIRAVHQASPPLTEATSRVAQRVVGV